MPLTRQKKESLVAEYQDGLGAADHVFVLGYQGISVPEVTELRAKVREAGASYVVVKNTLVLRAIADKALDQLGEHFDGPTAVAYSGEDPVALAKVLNDFAKVVPELEFKAGLLDGQPVAGEEVAAIATLPSREELLAKFLYLLQSPISRLAQTLAAVPRQLVIALDQVRQKKEQG